MSKLETLIERKKKQKVALNRRVALQQARIEAKKTRERVAKFKKDFKLLFAKLRSLEKCTFDKYHDNHVIFSYKGDKYSICFEKWLHEGYGVDGYDSSGTEWALHRWCGGWSGHGHTIIDSEDIKPGRDYSNKVIQMLSEWSGIDV